MSWLPLPIFPEGSLASSVITTVWVGVVVICFMNLRFGWVFSGLVVPGYLVPLMIVKPWAAAVIVLEAVMTFWTVRAITRLLAKVGVASAFFGRDRFLAMIVVSALYRVVADAWLLPMLGEYVTTQWGLAFDYRNNLHSFGLIVICLAANQLWKTGVVRGAFPFAFNILVTYVLVRYGLMEFTNFGMSNFHFLYEDLAASVYAAPKAYIVLITASFIASRMNLLYGWDFNGTMIPALIALQWYEPTKVLTSFGEALIILGVGVLVLKLSWFRSVTIEGARKLLLFFSISFLYKMAVGWALLWTFPTWKVSDFYGFGYLLPTLIAIKIHQQGKILHQLRITAQVSLVSMVVANVIGLALSFLPSAGTAPGVVRPPLSPPLPALSDTLAGVVRQRFVDAHAAVGRADLTPPRGDELYLFSQGLDALARSLAADNPSLLERAGRSLNACGFRLDATGETFLQVTPVDPATGRPFLLINRQTESDLVVECPRALDGSHSLDAALAVFEQQNAWGLAVAGAGDAGRETVLADYGLVRSWFAGIHRALGRTAAIQVRCESGSPTAGHRLYVKGALPGALNLQQLEQRFGAFTALWEEPPDKNPLRDMSRSGFCELVLGHAGTWRAQRTLALEPLGEPVDSLVRRELLHLAPKGSDLYRPPSAAELLHLDRYVVRPLFDVRAPDLDDEVPLIRHHAAVHGYQVDAYSRDAQEYLLLRETRPRRYWGSVLVRVPAKGEPALPLCLEVPSRVGDHSLASFAATQLKRLEARALIAAATHSRSNADGSTLLSAMQNRESFFNLAHQAFARGVWPAQPVIVQVRAFQPAPGEPYPDSDVILAAYQENRPADDIRATLAPMRALLESDGMSLAEVAEADPSSPYAVGINPQAKYLDFVSEGVFCMLWLSPFVRDNYRIMESNSAILKVLRAADIEIREEPLGAYLGGKTFVAPSDDQDRFKQRLRTFRDHGSILVLRQLAEEATPGMVEAVLDPYASQLFLVCLDSDRRPFLVSNLTPQAFERTLTRATHTPEAFADARAAWLEHSPNGQP